MGLLREVTNEQARAKVGAFGHQGSGKTTTLALLAIGISKTYHDGAPVAMMDTEAGADFLKPLFDAEGVKLLVHKSGAFADMRKVLQEAEGAGCCAFIMDSVTHTWRELVDSYCAAKARAYNKQSYSPQFQDWKDIKAQWATWTYAFINSPLHCFVAGRAGYEYEYQEGQDGKKELIKGDSKMKAEGEFGYEPSLLIEMEAERQGANSQHHGGSLVHIAHILKDRARTLNGKSFKFSDMNEYKAGDWKKVFQVFAPHFSFLNMAGTQRSMSANTSEELFDDVTGDSEARQRAQARKIALEEIENVMGVILWPGTSTDMKRIKLEVLNALFGVRSWAAVETMPLKKLEDALYALQEYEKAAPDAAPDGIEAILSLLRECQDKVSTPATTTSRAEAAFEERQKQQLANLPRSEPAAKSTNGAAQRGPMSAVPAQIPTEAPAPTGQELGHVPKCKMREYVKGPNTGKPYMTVAWGPGKPHTVHYEYRGLFKALQDAEFNDKPLRLVIKQDGKFSNVEGIEGYEPGQDGEWREPIQREFQATDDDIPEFMRAPAK